MYIPQANRSTTEAIQYARLRAYLSPAFYGPNTDAILTALAGSVAVPLVNLLEAINNQLYICTASGTYLDDKLEEYGISRPPVVGLSDQLFQELGIAVINQKQIRSLILNILSIIFGQNTTNANINSTNYEPYDLSNGMQLLIAFDGQPTSVVTFTSGQFANINAALAEEVADAITKSLRAQGLTGSAYLTNDGVGNLVTVQSDTEGPSSEVEILGGQAQNVLQFPGLRNTTALIGTTWTVTPTVDGGAIYAWTGAGPNPSLDLVHVGDYVNIFDPIFNANVTGNETNQGTYTVTAVALDGSSFTVQNYLISPIDASTLPAQFVAQTSNQSVLFYEPIPNTIASLFRFASVYQSQANLLEIIMPATSQIIRRDRIGAMYIHDGLGTDASTDYNGVYFTANTVGTIGNSISLVFNGTDTVTAVVNAWNLANTTNQVSFVGRETYATVNYDGIFFEAGNIGTSGNSIALVFDGFADVTTVVAAWNVAHPTNLVGFIGSGTFIPVAGTASLSGGSFYSPIAGTAILTGGSDPDPGLLALGPYTYDPQQLFTLEGIQTTLTQNANSTTGPLLFVNSTAGFPNTTGGYVMLDFGTTNQEGPIPYLAIPSDGSILLSPAYVMQKDHVVGGAVNAVLKQNVLPATNGSDYQGFATTVAAGREYGEVLINLVLAAGINVVFTIVYPDTIGLGENEAPWIWGETGTDGFPQEQV